METPNFIESYQTNAFDLCDAITDRLNYLLNEQFNGLSDEEKRLADDYKLYKIFSNSLL